MDSTVPGKGASVHLTGEDLVELLPEPFKKRDIKVENFRMVPSGHLTFDDLLALSKRIYQICNDDPEAGVVVTTGTDTLEEAAFFIDLTFRLGNCVVFTGAMRDKNQASPDGPRNIQDAIWVASSELCRDIGVLVCFNGEIHTARDVTKTHTTDVASFASPQVGLVGVVHDGQVIMKRKPLIREYINNGRVSEGVELIKCVLGDGGRIMSSLIESGIDGLVIEGFGGGHVTPAIREHVVKAKKKHIPIVMASRCPQGNLLKQTYGYPGSEIDLRELGVFFSGSLSGPKTRIKLALAVGHTDEQLKVYFPD